MHRTISKWLLERVANLERDTIVQAGFRRQHVGSRSLDWTQRDSDGRRAVLPRNVPAAAANPAAHVHHLLKSQVPTGLWWNVECLDGFGDR